MCSFVLKLLKKTNIKQLTVQGDHLVSTHINFKCYNRKQARNKSSDGKVNS